MRLLTNLGIISLQKWRRKGTLSFKETIANDAKPRRQECREELAGANQMNDQHFIQAVFQCPPRGDEVSWPLSAEKEK